MREKNIVRWIYNATVRYGQTSVGLRGRLKIECITEMMRAGMLNWFDHQERIRIIGLNMLNILKWKVVLEGTPEDMR